MTDEVGFGKFELDVRHLQTDMADVKGEVKSLRNVSEYLRTEIGLVKASIESLRTAIARWKLWIVVTGAATILSVWGAAVALARFLKP